jgi:hypothetical protein
MEGDDAARKKEDCEAQDEQAVIESKVNDSANHLCSESFANRIIRAANQ